MEQSSDLIFLLDKETGQILDVNKKACNVLGYAREQLLSMNILDIISSVTESISWEEQVSRVNKDMSIVLESTYRHSNGTFLPVDISLSPMTFDEKNYVLAMARNIADRKKIEESQRLVSLGKLVSSMAHEVNNPLMIISGRAQLSLADNIQNPKIKQNLEIMVDQCKRARDIIQRLLMFSKPSKGKLKNCDINYAAEEVVTLIEHQFSLANITIKRNFTANLPLVLIDKSQIQETFLNFLYNARETIQDGGVITVNTKHVDDFVEIDFKDTGCGMDAETMRKVMDPFFTTKEHGTGLGLAVSYGTIKAHGGEIKFESAPGKGTTVKVTLPVRTEEG